MVVFFSSEICFRTTRELEYFFYGRAKGDFFFLHHLTLGYMTTTLNQIIFFPPPKSEYLFQQHGESEYFFRKKPYPPPFKSNGRSLKKSGQYGNMNRLRIKSCMQ